LRRAPVAPAIERLAWKSSEEICAPHLIDVEVAQVLRRLERSGEMDKERGEEAIRDLSDMRIIRYGHEILMGRVWELRHNLTAYDAVYVALAEVLDAPLITCDGRLSRSGGHRARIRLVS